MKIFCKDLKDQAMKIINCEKKEMIPLTNEEKNHMKIRNYVIYAKKNLIMIIKSGTTVIILENTGELLIISVIDAIKYLKIPVVFLNGSTYDYHFIIKQLAGEFKGNFECLGENT